MQDSSNMLADYFSPPYCILRILVTVESTLQRLYKYIDGANEDKIKMPMTTPVATTMIPHEDYKGTDNKYTMSFYLPAKFQVGATSAPSSPVQRLMVQCM